MREARRFRPAASTSFLSKAWKGSLLAIAATILCACTGVVGEQGSNGERGTDPSGSPLAGPSAGGPGATSVHVAENPDLAGVAAGRGLFECPSVSAPAYEGTISGQADAVGAVPTLSAPFNKVCATCHGAEGQGKGAYPALPGKLDRSQFLSIVRTGKNAMPAFSAAFVTDAELSNDFDAIQALRGAPVAGPAQSQGEFGWTEQQVQQAYTAGLAMWRKPDAHGAACASCHSPDAVDLALIGYPDSTILRRALQHLSPDESMVVRDFVHAQRRRFDVKTPCSPLWHPFQPGGEVLAGNTPAEQDLSFLAVLRERNLQLLTGKIETVDQAKQAFAELAAINLRKLPIGIALPRWTEDRFNGDEHKSFNDYIPIIPLIPNAAASWYAMEDAYIANPTDDALFQMLGAIDKGTNDGGYLAANSKQINCPHYDLAGSWMTQHAQAKQRAVLIAQHLFRLALLKKDSWLEKPESAFPTAPTVLNPFFFIGGQDVEPPCYGVHPMLDDLINAFPAEARAELSDYDLAKMEARDVSHSITHPWMTLGELIDQPLFATEPEAENKLHYWTALNFVQVDFHEPFFYAHRVITQEKYWTDLKTSPLYPRAPGFYGQTKTHPFLDGERIFQVRLAMPADPAQTQEAAAALRFKGNILRSFLLVQRELLQQGAAVNHPELAADHCQSLGCNITSWKDYPKLVAGYLKDPTKSGKLADFAVDAALYVDDTAKLIDEVLALVAKAPTVATAQ